MVKTVVGINGMTCGMCEAHINDIVRAKFRVKKISSSYRKGEAVVLSEAPLDEERLKRIIAETGYTVTSVVVAPYEKKGLFASIFKK